MRRSAAFYAFPLLLTACSGSGAVAGVSDGGPSAPGDSSTEDAGTTVDAALSTPSAAKKACEDLIKCVGDVDPASAGALVTLYGDASNCWKGSERDAEACGKACQKALESRPECTAKPIDARYLALCKSEALGSSIQYDVALRFDPKSGGQATFKARRANATTFAASDVVATQPVVTLTIGSDGGKGETQTAFDLPASVLGPSVPSAVHVTRFSVGQLRVEKTGLCSTMAADITSPIQTQLAGACVYLPLAEGAPIPTLSEGAIRDCQL